MVLSCQIQLLSDRMSECMSASKEIRIIRIHAKTFAFSEIKTVCQNICQKLSANRQMPALVGQKHDMWKVKKTG